MGFQSSLNILLASSQTQSIGGQLASYAPGINFTIVLSNGTGDQQADTVILVDDDVPAPSTALVVTGTVTPDVTTNFYLAGTHNSQNYYQATVGSDTWYIAWDNTNTWFMSKTKGATGNPGWKRVNASAVGAYVVIGGTEVGTPTTAAGVPVSIDLTSLTGLEGAAVELTTVKQFIFVNDSVTDGENIVIGGGTNEWETCYYSSGGGDEGKIIVPAGYTNQPGFVCGSFPRDGFDVDGTNKIITVDSQAGADVPFRVFLIGVSA